MKIPRQYKQLADAAQAAGWRIEPTNGGHLRWTHPAADRPVFSAASPSDWRAVKNVRARLRRALPGGRI